MTSRMTCGRNCENPSSLNFMLARCASDNALDSHYQSHLSSDMEDDNIPLQIIGASRAQVVLVEKCCLGNR